MQKCSSTKKAMKTHLIFILKKRLAFFAVLDAKIHVYKSLNPLSYNFFCIFFFLKHENQLIKIQCLTWIKNGWIRWMIMHEISVLSYNHCTALFFNLDKLNWLTNPYPVIFKISLLYYNCIKWMKIVFQ